MIPAPTFYARRCDLSGKGINQGYVWRLGGHVTALGEPSEARALKLGYKCLKDAENDGAATFKAWTNAADIQYLETVTGQLESVGGELVHSLHRDALDDFAQCAVSVLPRADVDALVQCLAYGAAVMRERVRLATDERAEQWKAESDRAEAISARVACLAITSQDWTE